MDLSREASATVQVKHSEDLTEGAALGTGRKNVRSVKENL